MEDQNNDSLPKEISLTIVFLTKKKTTENLPEDERTLFCLRSQLTLVQADEELI